MDFINGFQHCSELGFAPGATLGLLVHEREGVEGHLALHWLSLFAVLDGRPTGRRPEDGVHRDGNGE